jgi:hypothetical protein
VCRLKKKEGEGNFFSGWEKASSLRIFIGFVWLPKCVMCLPVCWIYYRNNYFDYPIFKSLYAIGSALKPLLLTIAITSSSVIPFELTVRILSGLSVSTFQWQTPSALSKSDFTFDTQPPQLRLVLN